MRDMLMLMLFGRHHQGSGNEGCNEEGAEVMIRRRLPSLIRTSGTGKGGQGMSLMREQPRHGCWSGVRRPRRVDAHTEEDLHS